MKPETIYHRTETISQFTGSRSSAGKCTSIYVEEGKTSEYVTFARTMGKEITSNQED